MTAARDGELALLGQTCRDLFAKAGGLGRVRELRDRGGPHRFSAELWAHIAELGWLGVATPDCGSTRGSNSGSSGASALLTVLEAVGAALALEPVLSAVLALRLLTLAGSDEQRERWLEPILAGAEIPAVVGAQERRTRDGGGPRLSAGAGGPVLSGRAPYVLDGTVATVLLVLVDGPALLVLPSTAPGVRVSGRDLMDLRNWACVEFADVPVAGGGPGAEAAIERALDEATVGLAAEMLGSMWALFDRTLEYTKTRHQFGRPIGGFQAVQHRLARLYADLLLTDACVREAAEALDDRLPDATELVSAAKVRCVQSSRLVCREGVQLHGGMGVTDECDVGLYLKNLRVAEFVLGDQAWHADRWAALAAGRTRETREVDR